MTWARGVGAALLVSGALAVVWAGRARPVAVPLPPRTEPSRVAPLVHTSTRPDSLVRIVVGGNVFRPSRRPAAVSYDPRGGTDRATPSTAPRRPSLALVGLLGGEQPTAVIEGWPDVEGGRAVREGDVIGSLTVRRISRGEVRIVGMDTVWILKVRQPWR